MRAIVIDRFGGPEVLEVRDVPKPEPRGGDVLVRVVAAGTNPVDVKLRQDGSWAGLQPPAILGYDASGVVEAVGEGVVGLKPGDEVYYTPEMFGNHPGSYAEYHVASANIVARKPANLSHEEAAAIPLACGIAWEGIVRRLAVRIGETVLVHGGAGGVGSYAVQIAKASGAYIFSTGHSSQHDAMKALGVDHPIAYDKEDFVEVINRETGGAGVDAVFATVAGDTVGRSILCTRFFGRIAYILEPGGDLMMSYPKNLTLHGLFITSENRRLDEMRRVIERGLIKPNVAAVLPLEETRKAHEMLAGGKTKGKIVLKVRD